MQATPWLGIHPLEHWFTTAPSIRFGPDCELVKPCLNSPEYQWVLDRYCESCARHKVPSLRNTLHIKINCNTTLDEYPGAFTYGTNTIVVSLIYDLTPNRPMCETFMAEVLHAAQMCELYPERCFNPTVSPEDRCYNAIAVEIEAWALLNYCAEPPGDYVACLLNALDRYLGEYSQATPFCRNLTPDQLESIRTRLGMEIVWIWAHSPCAG